MDDSKISLTDSKVVTEQIKLLKECYGKEEPLTIKRDDVHDYLDMALDYSKHRKVTIDTKKILRQYLKKILMNMMENHQSPQLTTFLM